MTYSVTKVPTDRRETLHMTDFETAVRSALPDLLAGDPDEACVPTNVLRAALAADAIAQGEDFTMPDFGEGEGDTAQTFVGGVFLNGPVVYFKKVDGAYTTVEVMRNFATAALPAEGRLEISDKEG